MIAAGTQATEGNDCSPVMIGPNARRRSCEAASVAPIVTPTTTDMRNPTAARWTLVLTACHAVPSSTVARNVCQVSAGPGSAYGGLSSSRKATCQTTSITASAVRTGHTERHTCDRNDGRGLLIGVSSASRPAASALSDGLSGVCAATGVEVSVAMAGDLLTQVLRDLGAQRGHVGVLDASGLGDVDAPLARHPSGSRREQHDALAEPDGLTHVVGHEDDGAACLRPDADELLVQDVAGDRVERGERLVHEQEV